MKKILLLFILLPVISSTAGFSQCSRSQVINDYINIYLASGVSTAQLAWTGSTATCTAGTISSLAQTNLLARINYYRKLAGLTTQITFDAAKSAKAQQAALIMSANNNLSHSPTSDWLCYTTEGSQGAAASNLVLGDHSTAALDLYMSDEGQSILGHRRWILNSRPQTWGHGSTNNSDALYVTGYSATPETNPITFPSSGYFPAPLMPVSKYWSFGLYGASFTSATVQVLNEAGTPQTITVFTPVTGYADPTIVWEFTGAITNSQYDVKYTVKVNNVTVGGSPKNFQYDVIICQPTHPPNCPPGQTWSDVNCACGTATENNESLAADAGITANNPFTDILRTKISSPSGGDINVCILDITGRHMEERTLCMSAGDEMIISWDTSSWQKGLYIIVTVDRNGSRHVKRVIKQ